MLESILDNDSPGLLRALNGGCNPNIRDHDVPELWRLFRDCATGSFPLYEAVNLNSKQLAIGRDANVIRLLLEHGADANMVDDNGFSAIHQAAALNNVNALNLLIEHGADLHRASGKGYTPLHTAIYGKAEACIVILLRSGASLSAIGVAERDPLQYARELKRADLLALMESHLAQEAFEQVLRGCTVEPVLAGRKTASPR